MSSLVAGENLKILPDYVCIFFALHLGLYCMRTFMTRLVRPRMLRHQHGSPQGTTKLELFEGCQATKPRDIDQTRFYLREQHVSDGYTLTLFSGFQIHVLT